MAHSSIFRIPVPKTFLYLLSLRTGAELITLSLLINKVSGLYGILALLTGFHLSPPQLSMYIYSILALALCASLAPHVRNPQKPLPVIALAWAYLVDSIVNAGYTAAFGISWFLVLARHASPLPGTDEVAASPGGKMMGDVAGFTDPEHNVSRVDVVGPPAVPSLQVEGSSAPAGTGANGGALHTTILQSGSIASITVISTLWLVRMYFILVMFAYARGVLRAYIVSTSQSSPFGEAAATAAAAAGGEKEGYAENPFAAQNSPEGQGWTGKLGRALVCFPKSFWLGSEGVGDGEFVWSGRWARRGRRGWPSTGSSVGMGLRRGASGGSVGTGERERRRRKGTGPPEPSKELVRGASLEAGHA